MLELYSVEINGRVICQEYDDQPATTFGCMNNEVRSIFRSGKIGDLKNTIDPLVFTQLQFEQLCWRTCGTPFLNIDQQVRFQFDTSSNLGVRVSHSIVFYWLPLTISNILFLECCFGGVNILDVE